MESIIPESFLALIPLRFAKNQINVLDISSFLAYLLQVSIYFSKGRDEIVEGNFNASKTSSQSAVSRKRDANSL